MANNQETLLQTLWKMEDIAEKKARIYSRLLTDVEKAKQMEGLANRHQQAKMQLQELYTGKTKKGKTDGAGTR